MFAAVVGGLAVGAREAAGFDVAGLDGGELTRGALGLAEVISWCEVALAHVAGELEVRGSTVTEFGLSTASWLSREAGVPAGRAKRAVTVGRRLRVLSVIDAAVSEGRLRFDHAGVVAQLSNPRVAAGIVAVQGQIVEWTEGRTFDAWQRYLARFLDDVDQDGPHDPDAELGRNQLRLPRALDGVTRVEGQLVDEHGSVVTTALNDKADELFRRFRTDHHSEPTLAMPTRATLMALALVELCRQARATDIGATRAPRPDVTLIVRADEPDIAHDTAGVRLQDGTTRTLLCDPDLHAVIVDSLGVPLDLGRTERYATPAQRRALAVRDGGCVYPGCDRPPGWTDAHHSHEWDHGGTTDLHLLASLCHTTHHGITHRTGWTMHPTGDGWFYWTTPSGHSFWSQQHGQQRAGPTPADNPDGWMNSVDDRDRDPGSAKPDP